MVHKTPTWAAYIQKLFKQYDNKNFNILCNQRSTELSLQVAIGPQNFQY